MKRRILGFKKLHNGWNWRCNIAARIMRRAYNPLIIRWFSDERVLLLQTPQLRSYYLIGGRKQ